MVVHNPPGYPTLTPDPPTRTVVARFAGCTDADDAHVKARALYDVVAFKKVEPVEG